MDICVLFSCLCLSPKDNHTFCVSSWRIRGETLGKYFSDHCVYRKRADVKAS